MKKLHVMTLAALIMLGLSGCEKAKVVNVASADVFIKAIKNDQGIPVYAAIHSVFSYNTMTSVSAKSPDGTSIALINYMNTGNSFYNDPPVTAYSTTLPPVGAYTYAVKFNDGEEIPYSNTLSSSALLPANITSLVKSAKGDSVYISFDAIAGVDFYQIKVRKEDKQVFIAENLIDQSSPKKTNLRYPFLLSSLTSSISGTYTFEITGLLYESTAYDYLQAISTATKDIAL